MPDSSEFAGKTALIIGGTTGIGRATALAFAEAGTNVVIAGLGAHDGKAVEAEVERRGGAALFVEADVLRERDIEAVIAAAVDRFGRIHYAVNNAGIESKYGPLHESTSEEFDRIIGVNLKGIFLGLRHEIPHMIEHGGGAIVNTSSSAGVTGMANIAIYTASKHGVVGLTKASALEVARSNIRINAVAPGSVRTGLLDRMVEGKVPLSVIAENNPMGRIADPSEIATVILFLCSNAASYMTGTTVSIDGGFTVP
jgi:NAD(P)-dependent dehydrogenase (short-subunit alcohol dehydrogenase family)